MARVKRPAFTSSPCATLLAGGTPNSAPQIQHHLWPTGWIQGVWTAGHSGSPPKPPNFLPRLFLPLKLGNRPGWRLMGRPGWPGCAGSRYWFALTKFTSQAQTIHHAEK